VRFFATAAAWRAWLDEHHATATELVVGFHKRATGTACMTWSESVDEALCYGWIDARRHGVSSAAYAILFTRRRPTSIWSRINVDKVAALRAAGKMRPAGEAAFALRTEARTGVYSFERAAAATLSPEHVALLATNPAAVAYWDARPPGYRRVATHWVTSAKRDDTRRKRMAELVAACAAGRSIKVLARPDPKPGEARAAARGPARPSSRRRRSRSARARTPTS
jgi:uncharacterized protein YdeI (YjbR/CyaY-like superfamily)